MNRYDVATETARNAIEEMRLASYEQGYKDAVTSISSVEPTTRFSNENAKFTEMKLEKIRIFHSSYHMDKPEATRQNTLNLVVESYYSKYFHEIEEANRTNE